MPLPACKQWLAKASLDRSRFSRSSPQPTCTQIATLPSDGLLDLGSISLGVRGCLLVNGGITSQVGDVLHLRILYPAA